jgi:hypothetical protein
MDNQLNRRSFLRNTMAASAGTAFLSLEEKTLLAHGENPAPLQKPDKQGMPVGKIGSISMSRLICGGNLIAGSAHARDLLYVSELLTSYFTEEKIMETLRLCEENGINTIVANPMPKSFKVLQRYWREYGGQIQLVLQVFCHGDSIQQAIDCGAVGAHIAGTQGDQLCRENRMEEIAKAVEKIKDNGLIAGVAGHELRTPMAVEKAGIDVDFYVQTLHTHNYWSRKRPDQNKDIIDSWSEDNYFCRDPQATVDYMAKIRKPWIAYKVMAAGAIHPIEAFDYAFKNGADFILAGMFDFQVVEDAIIARQAIKRNQVRQRTWLA